MATAPEVQLRVPPLPLVGRNDISWGWMGFMATAPEEQLRVPPLPLVGRNDTSLGWMGLWRLRGKSNCGFLRSRWSVGNRQSGVINGRSCVITESMAGWPRPAKKEKGGADVGPPSNSECQRCTSKFRRQCQSSEIGVRCLASFGRRTPPPMGGGVSSTSTMNQKGFRGSSCLGS